MEKGKREKGAVKGNMDCEKRWAGNRACSKWFLRLIQEQNSLQHNFPLKPAASVETLACLWYIAFCINVLKYNLSWNFLCLLKFAVLIVWTLFICILFLLPAGQFKHHLEAAGE